MRNKLILAAVTTSTFLFGFSGPSLARVIPIVGTYTHAEIKSKCDAAHGNFADVESTGSYYCEAPNSNGVICDAQGNCVAFVHFVPFPQFEGTLDEVLNAATTATQK